MESKLSYFIAEDLPDNISEESIKSFFTEKLKKEKKGIYAKIFPNKELDITTLEELEGKDIESGCKLKLRFVENLDADKASDTLILKENEIIPYNFKYHEHCGSQFIQAAGDDSLKFIEQRTIDKQRGVIKHLLSKIGSNILSGTGIMNVSLPINIFDERSLLEVFAHQCRLSPYYLEKAADCEHPIDKLKFTTAFAISRIHLSVTQLKPFNPIWGETFQCKIGDTLLYMEQTSHHPPIYNFYHIGKNFKSYGHQQTMASTGANSVSAKTLGIHIVEYSDGTVHKIFPCSILISGTMLGDRTFAVTNKFYVVDEKNDYISVIEFNPDERGGFAKLFSKKKSFPDYFKGCVARLSQSTYNHKDNHYTLNKNYTTFASIHGEWSKNFHFDDELLWDFNDYVHFDLQRMNYTLRSDSTLREDIMLLKSGLENEAGDAKNRLEEIQRRDRKLRAEHSGNIH